MKRILLAAALVIGILPVTGAAASTSTCRHVVGPFHVRGSRIYNSRGQRYIPYGMNVTKIRPSGRGFGNAAQIQQEVAANSFWCVNTIRIGVEQPSLIVHGKVNHAYMAAVAGAASYAESLGLDVVLALGQVAPPGYPAAATYNTLLAWRALAYRYRGDPRVIFDIVNEPSGAWPFWRNGGRFAGKTFYGMERLAQFIRRQGAHNLLWVEGNNRASSLAGVPAYHLTHVGPVMYSEHRPGGPHTPARWRALFGQLLGHWPVGIGEWADYSREAASWACWSDAPVAVPRFLRYLGRHGIGLVAYDLAQPRLLESASLTDPDRIKSNWACVNGLNQGAGRQIAGFFRAHNR